MRRVLLRNDTEKPIGQLRQALLDAGYGDEVAGDPGAAGICNEDSNAFER